MKATETVGWGSPRLRTAEAAYENFQYDVTSVSYLKPPNSPPSTSFFSVLESRRSFPSAETLDEEELSALLWFTAKVRTSAKPRGHRWEHRPTPSAGGRHPVDLLISNWPPRSKSFLLYDPLAHALWRLSPVTGSAVVKLIAAAQEVTGSENGVVIWHVAQFARTISKYEEGESLVWRDAGALVGVTALVAEALGLVCCPIGLTGEPILSAALRSQGEIRGVGGCVVGGRASRTERS